MIKKQKPDLQIEIQQFQQRIDELDGNWKRALADYKNLNSGRKKAVRDDIGFRK